MELDSKTNVLGTLSLLEACRKIWTEPYQNNIFYHISTEEVYGSLGMDGSFNERSNPAGFSENLIQFVDDRAWHDFRYAINHNKITKELGWKTKTNFNDGVNETIKCDLKNV